MRDLNKRRSTNGRASILPRWPRAKPRAIHRLPVDVIASATRTSSAALAYNSQQGKATIKAAASRTIVSHKDDEKLRENYGESFLISISTFFLRESREIEDGSEKDATSCSFYYVPYPLLHLDCHVGNSGRRSATSHPTSARGTSSHYTG